MLLLLACVRNIPSDALQQRVDEDQAARLAEASDEDLQALSQQHLAWLLPRLERAGWPTDPIDSQNAWILCQHGTVEQIRVCLELGQGHADPQHIAMLTDTERVLSGQPQLYGTRVRLEDGVVRPCPIQGDPEPRRAEVGWPPLEDYLQQFAAPDRTVSTEPWPAC